jgi:hypothetical protein
MNDIRESDWKHFRQVRAVALERFCERILAEVVQLAVDHSKSQHERYLAVWKLLQERDDEVARAFNNPRRSAAVLQLVSIRALGLLKEEELAGFSPELRERLKSLLGSPG